MCIELGTHVHDQAARKGIGVDVVRAVLANPAITYKSFVKDDNGNRVPRMCNKHGVQQEKWTGEYKGTKVCVCVFTCCQKAVTVWFDQIETEIRPDQRRKGVKGYHGKDGKWRPA